MRPYNLTITGHGMTSELREYVEKRLERPTRHFDKIVDITICVKYENAREDEFQHTAEVKLHLKGKDIFISKTSATLSEAIDKLMDCLDRQIVAVKGRRQNHRHIPLRRALAIA